MSKNKEDLRQIYAGLAMTALLTNPHSSGLTEKEIAKHAVNHADALIKELGVEEDD